LVTRVREAGGTACYPVPLLAATAVFFLGFSAVRKRDARRPFYVAAGWAVVAVMVGFLGLLVSAALQRPVQSMAPVAGVFACARTP